MELDEIKNLWEKVNKLSEKTSITKEKILKMLQSSYKGSMKSLLNFELLGTIITLPCAFLLIVVYQLFYKASTLGMIAIYALSFAFVIGFFWQLYKYNYLKKIDIAKMNILQISEKMLKYRKYIVYEAIIAVAIFIVILIPLMYSVYTTNFGKEIYMPLISYYAIIFILGILLMLYLYKKMYFNNIKKIQESLAEIEDFQTEEE